MKNKTKTGTQLHVNLSNEEEVQLGKVLEKTKENKADFLRRVIQEQHSIHVEKKSPGVEMNQSIIQEHVDLLKEFKQYAAMIYSTAETMSATATGLNSSATILNASATQINISAADIREKSNLATHEVYRISALLRKLMNWSIMMYRVLGKPVLLSFRLTHEQYAKSSPIETLHEHIEKLNEHNEEATRQLCDGAREIIEHEEADHSLALKKYNFISKDTQ